MTEAKQDLIEASRNPIDVWICNNYNESCKGWLCSEALFHKPSDVKERTFTLYLKDKCIRKQIQSNKKRNWYYFLKEECKTIYHQTIRDEEEEDNNEEE